LCSADPATSTAGMTTVAAGGPTPIAASDMKREYVWGRGTAAGAAGWTSCWCSTTRVGSRGDAGGRGPAVAWNFLRRPNATQRALGQAVSRHGRSVDGTGRVKRYTKDNLNQDMPAGRGPFTTGRQLDTKSHDGYYIEYKAMGGHNPHAEFRAIRQAVKDGILARDGTKIRWQFYKKTVRNRNSRATSWCC
jgi:hypothetical protein